MKRFLLKYKSQGWTSEGVEFSDGKVAISEHDGLFDYDSFEEAMKRYPESEFELTWLDDEIDWTPEQLDQLQQYWNVLVELNGGKPAVVTTIDALRELRRFGLVQEEVRA